MTKWVFVQAMVDHSFDESDKPGQIRAVCFRYATVDAVDEKAAYDAGWRWSLAQNNAGVDLLNDLVVAI